MGMDSNAHSVTWGCERNNARGDDLELFAINNSLSTANAGNTPTFYTGRSSSIVDITLIHDSLTNAVEDWQVSLTDYQTDHRLISYTLLIAPPPPKMVKNYRRTDWGQTTATLHDQCQTWVAPMTWSEQILDDEVASFSSLLTEAMDAHTPSFIPKFRF